MNSSETIAEYDGETIQFDLVPQIQNMVHLFSYNNNHNELSRALRKLDLPYLLDHNSQTPMDIAIKMQSHDAINVIV